MQTDLYTTIVDGDDEDEFERFITREIEEPGAEAVEHLVARRQMKPRQWQQIALLVAAQQLRTPRSFLEIVRRIGDVVPDALEKTIREYEERGTISSSQARDGHDVKLNLLQDHLRISVVPPPTAGEAATVSAEFSSGRSVWLASVRQLLLNNIEVICGHRWRAVEACEGEEWPLTDHPVLNLNYHGPGKYDFEGAWGRSGSEFIMPVSPTLAVYMQVGSSKVGRTTLTPEVTRSVQRLLVERAFRWVIATKAMEWIAVEKPREINPFRFADEQEAWRRWHPDQAEIEKRFQT